MPRYITGRILQKQVVGTFWGMGSIPLKEGDPLEKYPAAKYFRCTQEESEEIRRRAAAEHKGQSEYLRDAALHRKIPVFDEEVKRLLRNLQENELKIGINVNQVVRVCNSKKYISRADYEKLVECLERIMELRREIIDRLIYTSK